MLHAINWISLAVKQIKGDTARKYFLKACFEEDEYSDAVHEASEIKKGISKLCQNIELTYG